MPSKVRMERIEDRIKQDLSNLIIQRVSDPRLSGVYVNDVRSTANLLMRISMYLQWKVLSGPRRSWKV